LRERRENVYNFLIPGPSPIWRRELKLLGSVLKIEKGFAKEYQIIPMRVRFPLQWERD